MNVDSVQRIGMEVCGWDTAQYYLFSKNVFSNLIYYSHLFPVLLSIAFVGVLFFLRMRFGFTQRLFYAIVAAFSVWALLDLKLWATEDIRQIMFSWSSMILIESFIYMVAVLIAYSQTRKVAPPKWMIGLLTIPLLPVAFYMSTDANLTRFDMTNCEREAIEGPLWLYLYSIEVLYTLIIVGLAFFRGKMAAPLKRADRLFIFGLIFFLFLFSFGNIVGFTTLDWSLAQYGLFGMPVMLGFLIYQVGSEAVENSRLLFSRLVSVAQIVLIASLVFVDDIQLTHYILAVTLIPLSIASLSLDRTIKSEIAARGRVTHLLKELQSINDQQTNLMHFITHQIKGFFTKTRNISSMALDGDFGPVQGELQKMLKTSIENDDRGVALVQELLNATNLKRGTVQYDMKEVDLRSLAKEAADMVRLAAESKGLVLEVVVPEYAIGVQCDAVFVKQALRNVVDNSVKYTPTGSVRVSVEARSGFGVVTVADTGIGLSAEDKNKLFTEGGRGNDSRKINVESTGYGLYIVKNVIEQHGGHVSADSEGRDRGSRFEITLPLKK